MSSGETVLEAVRIFPVYLACSDSRESVLDLSDG